MTAWRSSATVSQGGPGLSDDAHSSRDRVLWPAHPSTKVGAVGSVYYPVTLEFVSLFCIPSVFVVAVSREARLQG